VPSFGGIWCTGDWGLRPVSGCSGTWTCGCERRGAWSIGGLSTGLGAGKCNGGMGTAATGGTTTGTGITGAAGTGAAGTAAAGSGFKGLGAATAAGTLIGFGADASTAGGAGACWVGTMRLWLGLGCKATVERMPTARAISNATRALMPTTANPLPSSRTGLRRWALSSGFGASDMRTVGASASSSGTRL
jgi:hypothetical protein